MPSIHPNDLHVQGSKEISGFYADEMNRALDEQNFGIESFSILAGDASHALSNIETLEGEKLTVRLDSLGYRITGTSLKETVFDYIDSLLQSVSPQYESKRHELWVQKLTSITSTRDDDD